MLVQKKSNKRQFIMLALFVIIMSAAVYFFTIKPEGSTDTSFFSDNSSVSSIPVDTSIDVSIFGEDEVTKLIDRTDESIVGQHIGSASNKNVVVPPEDIEVYNPKVGKKLIIYWKNPDLENKIRIYRSEKADSIGTVIADNISDETNYQDTNLINGKIYYYTVKTMDANGNQSENVFQKSGIPTDIFPPASPTGVAVRDLRTGDKIEISWVNPPDNDFDYVRIYRSEEEGKLGELILDERQNETKYIDEQVGEGITYYYTLTAVDETGNESEKTLLPSDGNQNPFEPSF